MAFYEQQTLHLPCAHHKLYIKRCILVVLREGYSFRQNDFLQSGQYVIANNVRRRLLVCVGRWSSPYYFSIRMIN